LSGFREPYDPERWRTVEVRPPDVGEYYVYHDEWHDQILVLLANSGKASVKDRIPRTIVVPRRERVVVSV